MNIPKVPIVPAIIPASATEIITFTQKLTFVHEIHIDIVDGDFVPAVSWPIGTTDTPLQVKSFTDAFTLEVDLMIKNPIPAARAWEQAGADMIVFHVETVDEASFTDFCKHTSVSVGVAFHDQTHIDSLKPYLPSADYIQVMGIEQIGAQGQPFSSQTLEKVATLKSLYPHIPISVDGSVNKDTIKQIINAGVDRVIVGSAISRSENMIEAYNQLVAIVNE